MDGDRTALGSPRDPGPALTAAGPPRDQRLPGGLPAGIDDLLSGHPRFGDSARIIARARRRHTFALEIVGRYVAPVRAASAGLDEPVRDLLLRDPVVRIAVEDALRRLEAGRLADEDPVGEILSAARRMLDDEPTLLPTQAEERDRVSAVPGGGIWMMTRSGAPGPLRRRLLAAVSDQFLRHNGMTGEIVPADGTAAARLTRGCELLTELLPRTGAGVIRHIDCVIVMRAGTARGRQLSAAGGDLVPGTVVIDPDLLADPWEVAATVLHEGLHLKSFDITRLFALVAPGAGTVPVPWRTASWDTRRVLFAFHVYAHLTLLRGPIERHRDRLAGPYGTPPDTVGLSHGSTRGHASAPARARFLGDQLTGPLSAGLAPEGRQLVRWLREVTGSAIDWEPVGEVGTGADPQVDDLPVAARPVRVPGLWLRPEPDLECLLVFNPGDRRLHTLNLTAWAALELCDGRTDLPAALAELLGSRMPAVEANRLARLALARLRSAGLIDTAHEGR